MSTIDALTEFYAKVVKSVDRGDNTLAVFLDLSKAFDTLPHDKLLYKLHHYGIRGVSLKFFTSYLENRNMFVHFNEFKSDTRHINCGVPQGSVLGPLLFLIYVNDLYRAVLKSSVIQFADDTTLYKAANCNKTLFADINEDLKHLSTWFKSNNLSLNALKTHYVLFRGRRKRYDDEFSLLIDNKVIKRCSNAKFLGMNFDEFLTWDAHVHHIGKKLSSCIYSMNSMKYHVDSSVLKKIYHSLFESYLRYGIHLWANTSTCNLNYLLKLQKKAVRIICKVKYNEHTAELFNKLHLLNIEQLINKSFGNIMYKFVNRKLPLNIQSLFSSNEDVHSHFTRQHTNPHFTKHRTQIYSKSFLHRSKTFWQSLPFNIKSYKTVKSFNKHVNNYLLSSNIQS